MEKMENESEKLVAFLKEQERRDQWYWGFQHETYTKAIEQGRKDPRNCQKCGGHGFISVFRSYAERTKPDKDGKTLTGRRWIWELRPCECQTRRAKVAKEERTSEKEARKMFA